MRKSQGLRGLMYIFITATLVLIFSAIAIWEETPLSVKLAAGGGFSLIDAVAFALLMMNQEVTERTEDIQPQRSVTLNRDLVLNKLIASQDAITKIETRYYCPKCKEYVKESDVWGEANNKLHRKCETQTIMYLIPVDAPQSVIRCPKCGELNDTSVHNYCFKCQAVLPSQKKLVDKNNQEEAKQ